MPATSDAEAEQKFRSALLGHAGDVDHVSKEAATKALKERPNDLKARVRRTTALRTRLFSLSSLGLQGLTGPLVFDNTTQDRILQYEVRNWRAADDGGLFAPITTLGSGTFGDVVKARAGDAVVERDVLFGHLPVAGKSGFNFGAARLGCLDGRIAGDGGPGSPGPWKVATLRSSRTQGTSRVHGSRRAGEDGRVAPGGMN